VAIELKLGRFNPSHKGQMELYLKWLDKYEEHVELLELDKNGIYIAQYLTALPT